MFLAIQKWYGLVWGLHRNSGTLADSSRTSRHSVTLIWQIVAGAGEHSRAKATISRFMCSRNFFGRFLEQTRTLRFTIFGMEVRGAENTYLPSEFTPKSKPFGTSISSLELNLDPFAEVPGLFPHHQQSITPPVLRPQSVWICPTKYQNSALESDPSSGH